MYIATSTPASLFAATNRPFWPHRHVSRHLSRSEYQQIFTRQQYKSNSASHRASAACASSKFEPVTRIAEGETKSVTVRAEIQLPVLPLGLLGSLSAAWLLTARGSLALQCSTLLLLDIVYAGLHLQPLLPLFQIGSSPDVAFMHSYTKAAYFVSECLLLGWLLSNGVIRASIPSSVLALHGAVHIGFVVLAAQAPGWCMQQQIQRINNGWNMRGLVGKWHVLVNMVNFADLALHLSYISVLWQSLASAGSPTALMQEPWKTAVVGAILAYLMAHWLPQQQQDHGS